MFALAPQNPSELDHLIERGRYAATEVGVTREPVKAVALTEGKDSLVCTVEEIACAIRFDNKLQRCVVTILRCGSVKNNILNKDRVTRRQRAVEMQPMEPMSK